MDPRAAGLEQLGWGGDASAADTVRLMQQFADAEMASQGCFRLNRLARRGDWQAVLDADGLRLVMDVMKAHPNSVKLQEEGLHALGYLLEMGGDAALAEVRDADGVMLLQTAMDNWSDQKFFQYFCSSALEKLLVSAASAEPRESADCIGRPASADQGADPDPGPGPEPQPELEAQEGLSLPYSFAPGGGGGGGRRLLPPVYI